jgi:hypothetical protein
LLACFHNHAVEYCLSIHSDARPRSPSH